MQLADFKIGDSVELHPGTDRWMRGDRFGAVVKIGRKHLHVKMDVSGQTIRVHPDNIGRYKGAWL